MPLALQISTQSLRSVTTTCATAGATAPNAKASMASQAVKRR